MGVNPFNSGEGYRWIIFLAAAGAAAISLVDMPVRILL